MGTPVVIAENGLGVPVTPVEGNAPVMTVAANGLGAPIVISEFGAPFVVEGITPPVPPVPGPLDYIENGEGLSEIRVEYDLARPVAMMGIAFRHDGSVSSLTATHGGDALELVDFILNEQENIGSATFIGNGLKIEPADLVITPVGGTIGPAVMRIDDSFAIDYVEVGIHEGRQGASYIGAATQPVPVVFSPVDGTGWGVYALACASAEKFSDARGLNGAAPTQNLFWGVASSGTLGPVPDWATIGAGWSQDGDWWEHTGATSYLIGEDFDTPVQNPFWWEIEVDVAEGARLYVQTVGGGGHLSELFMGPVSGVFRRYRNQNYTGYRFNMQSIGDAKFRNFQYCTDGQTVYGSFGRTVNQVPEGSSLQFQIGALSRYAGIVMEAKEGDGPPWGVFPLIAWGDSLTEGTGANTPYPAQAGLLFSPNRTVVNKGVGSQTSVQIAARMGAIPIGITTSGNIIPATDPVAVDSKTVNILFRAGAFTGTSVGAVVLDQTLVPVEMENLVPGTPFVDNGDGTYTIGTGAVIRFRYPLESLVGDREYELRLEVTGSTINPAAPPGQRAIYDFCDTNFTQFVAAGVYEKTVSRATFTSTFRFVDVDMQFAAGTITVRPPTLSFAAPAIPGTMSTDSGGNWTFTRTASGTSLDLSGGGAVFVPDDADDFRNYTAAIWAGRNDNALHQQVIDSIAAMVEFLGHGRSLVLSILTAANDGPHVITRIGALNTELSETYGGKFLDAYTILRANGNGSADDNADIAAGFIPRSLRVDDVHLNTAGYAIVAQAFVDKVLSFGG